MSKKALVHFLKKKTNELFLQPKDYRAVLAVLNAVKRSAFCEIGIGGSVGQRALLPEYAKAISHQRLSDVDLLLIGGSLQDCPILPSIKDDFYVISIQPTNRSYYFRMTHKPTRIGVDLFSPLYFENLVEVEIAGLHYRATSIEGQILQIARNILWREKTHKPINRKSIERARTLSTQSAINLRRIENEFSAHADYFLEVTTLSYKAPSNAEEFIELALAVATSSAKHSSSAPVLYSADSIVTSNGIDVDKDGGGGPLWE
ncbi:MAG: hypothetical protein HYX63_17555 [Gammaproteobacteria bacterium]|nr:hypothetical protein [Gammaproteobacteria bacterium]